MDVSRRGSRFSVWGPRGPEAANIGESVRGGSPPTGVPRRDPYPWRILQADTHMSFSDTLYTVERYARTNMGTMTIETTVDDLVAYTKPFTITFTARLRPGEELMEYLCNENNNWVGNITGPAKEC